MTKMRAVQVARPKGSLELVERDIPNPGPGQVRIKVHACGICHSDSIVVEGIFPIQYPRIPGHEAAGVIDAVGAGVTNWKPGQKVGVGWYGGHDGTCESCRRGDFVTCQNGLISGVSFDGGYAEYMVAPQEALALIPEGLSFIDAGPLMCAGITTFNALRNSGVRPGELVAIQGIGGLGHLGVQFASKMGFKTVAIARGQDKKELALKLGARYYIDTNAQNVTEELNKLGGAKAILATATSGKAIASTVDGLAVDGKLIIVGAAFDPLEISAISLIMKRRSIVGWPSGTSIDSQDALEFSARMGIRSMNEVFPLEKAPEAYARMMSGKARFRVVLTT